MQGLKLNHVVKGATCHFYWCRGPFSIYGWARSQPMREDITYVTSSLIGWDLAQPFIENGLFCKFLYDTHTSCQLIKKILADTLHVTPIHSKPILGGRSSVELRAIPQKLYDRSEVFENYIFENTATSPRGQWVNVIPWTAIDSTIIMSPVTNHCLYE